MKRQIADFKLMKMISGCCPGHDDYPDTSYGNRRSKKARSKGIGRDHRCVRSLARQQLRDVVRDCMNGTD